MVLRRFPLSPSAWKPSLEAARVLLFDYAHLASARSGTPVDARGEPLPWYTYPAIEYLKQLDFSRASVFEYGAGHSTLFWASTASRVVSVEDDQEWCRILSPRLPSNCQLILETDIYEYPAVIRRSGDLYDVIVVDGVARGMTRLKCAAEAVAHLRPGGLVILDNADWLPESARLLRSAGLIEVDMTGLGPVNRYAWTTSLFLHRAFAFTARGDRQPAPGTGAWAQTWEHPIPTEPPLVECRGEVFGGVRRDERFEIASPSGPYALRLIVSEIRQRNVRVAALIDVAADRVLLSLNEPFNGTRSVEAALDRLVRTPWHEFQRAVNADERRRFDLPEHPGGPRTALKPPRPRSDDDADALE
jgi:hypothetical protein